MGLFGEKYGGTIFSSWLNKYIHCGRLIENMNMRIEPHEHTFEDCVI